MKIVRESNKGRVVAAFEDSEVVIDNTVNFEVDNVRYTRALGFEIYSTSITNPEANLKALIGKYIYDNILDTLSADTSYLPYYPEHDWIEVAGDAYLNDSFQTVSDKLIRFWMNWVEAKILAGWSKVDIKNELLKKYSLAQVQALAEKIKDLEA